MTPAWLENEMLSGPEEGLLERSSAAVILPKAQT